MEPEERSCKRWNREEAPPFPMEEVEEEPLASRGRLATVVEAAEEAEAATESVEEVVTDPRASRFETRFLT